MMLLRLFHVMYVLLLLLLLLLLVSWVHRMHWMLRIHGMLGLLRLSMVQKMRLHVERRTLISWMMKTAVNVGLHGR